VDTWKRIGAVFASTNTAEDALQWINNAMQTYKVKIIDEGSLVKLIFVIKEANKTRHYVEIPISGDGQMTSHISTNISADINTASFTTGKIEDTQAQFAQQDYSQNIQQATTTATTTTATTTTTTTTNAQANLNEFGIDTSKIMKQTVNPNTADIIKSIEEEKKLRLSQTGKITTENYIPEVKVEIP
jgi:hypothetical protein